MIYFCTKFVHIHITQNKSIMKNTVLMSVMFLLTFLFSCTSQTYVDEKSLDQFINSNELTFMAKRANPTNFDVINVMNSMPNNNSARMLNLDYGYSVVLEMILDLDKVVWYSCKAIWLSLELLTT